MVVDGWISLNLEISRNLIDKDLGRKKTTMNAIVTMMSTKLAKVPAKMIKKEVEKETVLLL